MKPWKQSVSSLVCCLVITPGVATEVLLLEPNIQGHSSGQIVHATFDGDRYYFNVQDMADVLNFRLDAESENVNFMGRSFSIANPTPDAQISIDGQDYYTGDFYQQRLPLLLNINPLDMRLDIFSDYTLPTTRRIQNDVLRRGLRPMPVMDSFDNYEFDRRYFAAPVVDLSP